MGKKSKKKKKHPQGGILAPAQRQFVVTVGHADVKDVKDAEYETAAKYFRRGNYEAAVQVWEKIRSKNPSGVPTDLLAEAHLRCASNYCVQRGWGRTVYHLQKAVHYAPKKAVYWFHLGLAHHKRGDLESAIGAYRRATEIAPNNPRFQSWLALCLAERGDLPGATQLLASSALSSGVDAQATQAIEPLLQILKLLVALRNGSLSQAVYHLWSSPPGSVWERIENLLRGLTYLALGEEGKAERLLSQLSSSASKDGSKDKVGLCALYYLGLLRLCHGDALGAWALWEPHGFSLKTMFPEFSSHLRQAVWKLSAAEVEHGNWEEAIRLWDRLRALGGMDAQVQANLVRALWLRANELAEEERMREAFEHWQKALQYEPDNINLMHNLAIALERMEEPEVAARYWESVVREWEKREERTKETKQTKQTKQTGKEEVGEQEKELRQQGLKLARKHLARSYYNLDEYRKAARVYRRVLASDPSDWQAMKGLANVLVEMDERDKAVELYEKYLELKPEDAEAWNDLGVLYDLTDDDDEAIRCWERALRVEPQNKVARRLLANALHRQAFDLWRDGDSDEALDNLQRYVALLPDRWEPYVTMGRIHLDEGDEKRAKECFEQAVSLSDDPAEVCVIIGRSLMKDEEETEASVWLERAAKEAEDRIDVMVQVALAYAESSRYQKQGKQLLSQLLDRAEGLEEKEEKEGESKEKFICKLATELVSSDSPLALHFLNEAMQRMPESGTLHLLLAFYYAKRWDKPKIYKELAIAYEMAKKQGDEQLMRMVEDLKQMVHLMPLVVQAVMSGLEFLDDFEED